MGKTIRVFLALAVCLSCAGCGGLGSLFDGIFGLVKYLIGIAASLAGPALMYYLYVRTND